MAGMKSALELAMEKINAQQSQAETLSPSPMRNGRRLVTCASNTTPKLPKKTSCCRPISASLYNTPQKRWLQHRAT